MLKTILKWDEEVSTRLRVAEKPGWLRRIAIFFAHSGDSWFWGAALIALWFIGSPFWKDWAVVVLISISLLAVIVLVIKFSIRRKRPAGEWGGIYRNTDPHSFPSGHAARSFLIAVLSASLGPGWLAVILCIWAPLVSLARVAMGVHYASDVAAGALLGVLVGLACIGLSGWMLAAFSSLLSLL